MDSMAMNLGGIGSSSSSPTWLAGCQRQYRHRPEAVYPTEGVTGCCLDRLAPQEAKSF